MAQGLAHAPVVPLTAASAVDRARDDIALVERQLWASADVARANRADWADLASACQRLVNAATALQDSAITGLAAIEEEVLEDGTLVESHRLPGLVALDAPDIVAGALGVSHVHAQRRVSLAVLLVPPDDDLVRGHAGLGGLHAAMVDGVLDPYRASVVAEELAGAPAEVAGAVVAALGSALADDPPGQLRRRCRRILGRISPDLLVGRAKRARETCGLRRWVQEPGVDRWEGTFPTEQAAEGWAAVDALAQRYVAEGRCARVEAARGEALMDLIRGQATIDVQLVVTVPAEVASKPSVTTWSPTKADEAAVTSTGARGVQDDLVEVSGPLPGEPVLVGRRWVGELLDAAEERRGVTVASRIEPCHPRTGALLGSDLGEGRGYRPGRRLAALVRARDGRCRFPACSVAARFCDLDHVSPWPGGATAPNNLICLCRRHHRIKQRAGWRVRLLPDARTVWTDPTGRRRASWPRDVLTAVVLRAPSRLRASQETGGTTGPVLGRPTAPPGVSTLEVLLSVHAEHGSVKAPDWGPPCRSPVASPGRPRAPVTDLRESMRGRFRYRGRASHARASVRAGGALRQSRLEGNDPPPF